MTTTKCTCPTDVAELCERTLEQKPYYCATHAPEGSTSTPDPLASTIRQVLDQHTDDAPPPSATPAHPAGDVALNSPSLEQSVAAALGATVHTPHHD